MITPRWLFVLAQATPADIVGNPVIVDEAIAPFDLTIVNPGDIVGIGISTGNCLPGYRALREARARGATVIASGKSEKSTEQALCCCPWIRPRAPHRFARLNDFKVLYLTP